MKFVMASETAQRNVKEIADTDREEYMDIFSDWEEIDGIIEQVVPPAGRGRSTTHWNIRGFPGEVFTVGRYWKLSTLWIEVSHRGKSFLGKKKECILKNTNEYYQRYLKCSHKMALYPCCNI